MLGVSADTSVLGPREMYTEGRIGGYNFLKGKEANSKFLGRFV